MGLFDKLFGKTSQSRQNATDKKAKEIISREVPEFIYSDFKDLKTNTSYDRFFAGNLKLPTGQVVCADPLHKAIGLPQFWTVTPGDYPVYLYIGLNGFFEARVAYAELSFKDEIPVTWEWSIISEDLPAGLIKESIIFPPGGFPVENGLGSFSDYETWKLYNQEMDDFYKKNKKGNYYSDVLESRFKANAHIPESSRGEDWINYTPTTAAANIIMFASGWGDGFYPRYVGFDKNMQAVKFITDFIQLADDDTNEEE